MKTLTKPNINDYPSTDSRTFINFDNTIKWAKYVHALEEYIIKIESLIIEFESLQEVDINTPFFGNSGATVPMKEESKDAIEQVREAFEPIQLGNDFPYNGNSGAVESLQEDKDVNQTVAYNIGTQWQEDKAWKDMTPAERLRAKGLIEGKSVFSKQEDKPRMSKEQQCQNIIDKVRESWTPDKRTFEQAEADTKSRMSNFMQTRELTDEEWLKLPKEEILQLYKNCYKLLQTYINLSGEKIEDANTFEWFDKNNTETSFIQFKDMIEEQFPTDIEVIRKNELSCDIYSTRRSNLLKQEGAKWALSLKPQPTDEDKQCMAGAISMIRGITENIEELNMNNYTEEQVRSLNDAMIEVYQIVHPPNNSRQ